MTKEIKEKLCEMHGREYALLLGNATAAIALTLQAAGVRGKEVAIPNNVCINVPMGVYFSGNQPRYLDICKDDFGLNPKLLERCIDEVDAVIAVHAYGMPCKIKMIEEICRKQDVFLIEDFAVAQGTILDDESVGRYGDVSITSFGAGKIIDIGHGGALLTNDLHIAKELAEQIYQLSNYSDSFAKHIEGFGRYHTDLYNRAYETGINRHANQFKVEALSMRSSYMYKFDPLFYDALKESLSSLQSIVEDRVYRYEQIMQQFVGMDDSLVTMKNIQEGAVPWRANLLIHNDRDDLLRLLIKKKYKISSWHPSVDMFFESRKESMVDTLVSDLLSDRILNIWTNEEVDSEYIYAISDDIKKFVIGKEYG